MSTHSLNVRLCPARLGAWRPTTLFPLILALAGLLSLSACTGGAWFGQEAAGGGRSSGASLYATSGFGPDGRLWRVTPEARTVTVAYSDDEGASFSTPVSLSAEAQSPRAAPDDRPSIAVDKQGRVHVTYYAAGPAGWVLYYSFSGDGGRSFSPPQALTGARSAVRHHQDILAASPAGPVYLFGYTERGAAGASLLYTTADQPEAMHLPDRPIQEGMCECCRIAVDFDPAGRPVLFTRMIYPGSVRDHGLIAMGPGGNWQASRVTQDDWELQACPEHGPALAIAQDGRYHITWFTQGRARKGLFYAHSDDGGRGFSAPVAYGDNKALAGHGNVLAVGERVVLVWKEFDGHTSRVMVRQSRDRGQTWSAPTELASSPGASDHPFLLGKGGRVFLSWNLSDRPYRLIPIG